ncbi:MAG: lytic transglycosylase domain-containing protein [Chloroflexi bacterium]|nr:lytic transglycosylase domain-containing protein [Chloroflexota bacterium]
MDAKRRAIALVVLAAGFALLLLGADRFIFSRLDEDDESTTSQTNPNSRGIQTIDNTDAPLAAFYEPQVLRWQADIVRWAQEYGLNPNVVAIIMQIESCGNPTAMSPPPDYAMGLMQVIPANFHAGDNMLDPNTNVRRSLFIFRECLELFAGGDLGLAFACYNGSPRVVNLDYDEWFSETQSYYDSAIGIWDDVINGRSTSPAVEEWARIDNGYLCVE